MRRTARGESMIDLEVMEELLPLTPVAIGDIVPETLDPCVMYAPEMISIFNWTRLQRNRYVPAPNVGSSLDSLVLFHPLRHS